MSHPSSAPKPAASSAMEANSYNDHSHEWMANAPKDITQVLFGDNPTIWVFGYGSLLWKPDFQYKSKVVGYIAGYERRFYQGNETFRGVPGKPGRVANLVDNKDSNTWGVAYEISGREEVASVLKNLYQREATNGGYTTLITTFYPRQPKAAAVHKEETAAWDHNLTDEEVAKLFARQNSEAEFRRSDSAMSVSSTDSSDISSDEDEQNLSNVSSSSEDEISDVPPQFAFEYSDNAVVFQFAKDENNNELEKNLETKTKKESKSVHNDLSYLPPVQALVYTVTPDNPQYLGPDDLTSMARQIATAAGFAGTNVEYVTKIAEYIRKYIPEDDDQHLFALEAKVIEEVHKIKSHDRNFTMTDFKPELSDLDHDVRSTEPVRAS